jgi:protein SCO1
MKRVLLLIAIGVIVAVATATIVTFAYRQHTSDTSLPAHGPYRGGQPPPGVHLAAFALRDQRDQTVTTRGLAGKIVVFTFLDSACKDSCPIIAGAIAAAIDRLSPGERKQVAALALTVNPATDTPRSVIRFLRARNAYGKLDFLLGTVQTLKPVWKKFGVIPATETGDADIHSADVRIFDRHGIWVATQHPGVDLTPANLAHDIRVALRGQNE